LKTQERSDPTFFIYLFFIFILFYFSNFGTLAKTGITYSPRDSAHLPSGSQNSDLSSKGLTFHSQKRLNERNFDTENDATRI
jgi:hypothetical protein